MAKSNVKWKTGAHKRILKKNLGKATEVVLNFLVGDAKTRAPVGTPESTGIKNYQGGKLRSSIDYERDGLVGFYGSNVHYAIYQEMGTENMKAQPYLLPAYLENKKDIDRLFKKAARRKT